MSLSRSRSELGTAGTPEADWGKMVTFVPREGVFAKTPFGMPGVPTLEVDNAQKSRSGRPLARPDRQPGRITHVRTMCGLDFDTWETTPVPRSVALEARIALGELLVADKPPRDARELQRYKMALEGLKRELAQERAKESRPGSVRERREAYDEANGKFGRAYAEYTALVAEGQATGVEDTEPYGSTGLLRPT